MPSSSSSSSNMKRRRRRQEEEEDADLTPREDIPNFSNFSSVSFNSLLPLISLDLNAAECFLNSGPSDVIHAATAASSQSFTKKKWKQESNHVWENEG